MGGPRAGENRLRSMLLAAEDSARSAADEILLGISHPDRQVRAILEPLVDYCRTCPDPFQSLDIARVLRALVEAVEARFDQDHAITEWAFAELRVQALCARVSRVLRDEGAHDAEQALVDLSVMRLHALEDGPHYPSVLGEMARIVDSGIVTRPVAPVEEFFGLARQTCWLPVRPPGQP